MKSKTSKILAICSFLYLTSNVAYSFNVDVNLNTTTRYKNCEHHALNIVEFTRQFIEAENDETRANLKKIIEDNKYQLERCERHNNRWYRTTRIAGGGQLSYTVIFK